MKGATRMSSVNDQVSSELEKEGVASASTEESVSRDEPEARQEAAPSPEELLAALQNAEREKIELTEALARARADFFNYRKRVDRDRQKERSMIAEEKALDFLPVLDNLDRALSVSPDIDGKSVLQGVAMVRKQFLAVLESMGVEAVPSIGSVFSPEYHEAVVAVATDDPEKNGIVMEEIQSGYRTKERVLRPAKVKVASYTVTAEKG